MIVQSYQKMYLATAETPRETCAPQRLSESRVLVTPLPWSPTRPLAAFLGLRIQFLVCDFSYKWVRAIYKFYRFIENVPPGFRNRTSCAKDFYKDSLKRLMV